jgi:hypothetical protein
MNMHERENFKVIFDYFMSNDIPMAVRYALLLKIVDYTNRKEFDYSDKEFVLSVISKYDQLHFIKKCLKIGTGDLIITELQKFISVGLFKSTLFTQSALINGMADCITASNHLLIPMDNLLKHSLAVYMASNESNS